jgi:hypothetical protein
VRRAILAALLGLMAPSVAVADTWVVSLTWTNNGGDGFTIQRKDAHCLVDGTFVDIAHVLPGVPFADGFSPFPHACYRVRATLSGAVDSADSNDASVPLPQSGRSSAGLRR